MFDIHAHAKVNLFLNIIGQRPNGYHDMQSYFLKLNLADELYIQPSDKIDCSVEGKIIIGENIVLKTIHYFSRICNISKGISVHIKKNIPIAAGLGGGSSNAAAVLKLLPKLWNVKGISEKQLKDIAIKIGADVPFFLKNQNAFVEGIGDILTPLTLGWNFFIILINPEIEILTKNAYKSIIKGNFSKKIEANSNAITNEIFYGKNDLEQYAKEKYPIRKQLIEEIKDQENCIISRMSGSGSTCFGIFEKKKDVINAVNNLSELYPNFWIHYEKVIV